MNRQVALNDILSGLTPERLKEIVLGIAKTRPVHDRSGVSLPSIVDDLTRGVDLGTGAEAWAAQLKLKQAIIETVALIPGMQYVEGDA